MIARWRQGFSTLRWLSLFALLMATVVLQTAFAIGVDISASSQKVCTDAVSHVLTVEWNVTGAGESVEVAIEVVSPDGTTQTSKQDKAQGRVSFNLSLRNGGSVRVQVAAQTRSGSTSGLVTVLLTPCADTNERPSEGETEVLNAPKWLNTPTVDGDCADPEYADAEAGLASLFTGTHEANAQVKLLHSGLDFYLCFAGLPRAGQRAVVRADANHDRSEQVQPGDYEFSVTSEGDIRSRQGNAQGSWEPLRVPLEDVEAMVSPNRGTWNAEMRIGLEWLGGYARTDGLSLAVEGPADRPLGAWPASAVTTAPVSWGKLVLEPLYRDGISAGSAFVDGREGYLVVPYAPELNPAEITVEAWVKVAGGDCGTLVGNGRNESYWLALCQAIQFGHDGRDSVLAGQIPLGDGWRHVAVTMDAATGLRTLYVDGEVDRHGGWEPAEEKSEEERSKEPEKLGFSDRMLRIGSDRDAPSELDRLHGYINELRIWDRARTAQEIRETAFQRLSGREPGLVALWPFTDGLQDLVGNHDAGLIANASLARETRDVMGFPPRPEPLPYIYPSPKPILPWDSHIRFAPGEITVDGICSLPEYPEASQLILEPDRAASMRLVVAGDALYLCTNMLWGGPGLESSVTLWINRHGQGGLTPGPADLRVQLTPDGGLTAATGDGSGYTGPAPQGFSSETIAMPRLESQEDVRPVDSPVWMSELRIPWEALNPFVPGQRLRFALLYQGRAVAGARSRMPESDITRQWPAQFDPQQPDTWGIATTEQAVSAEGTPDPLPAVIANTGLAIGQTGTRGMILITPEVEKALTTERLNATLLNGPTPWPRPAPTEEDFDDGCGWDHAAYTYSSNAKWPKVDADNHPTVKAEGTLSTMGISRLDAPLIHDTHDLDMHMSVRPEDRWIVINGGEDLVLENESGPFDERALPREGDHVTVAGRWIFDCGHDPKTEIHPVPFFESDRLESLPSQDGTGSAKLVRVARIRLTSDPGGAFTYVLNPISFSMDLPPASYYGGNRLPFLRVVEGPASHVALTGLSDTKAVITISPPASTGDFYWKLMLGYLDPPNPPSAAGKGYTVTLDKIEIFDDMDSPDSGDWVFFVAFNSTWQKVWEQAEVDSGESYDINRQFPAFAGDDQWGGHLYLRVIGYEHDWNAAGGGDDIVQGGWDLGLLKDRCCGQNTWQRGPWKLYFTVTEGYDGPTALPKNDSFFWLTRLVDEPNDPIRKDLGALPVLEGSTKTTEKNSYLTKDPMEKNAVLVLANDVDRFLFALEDFADVEFGPLPSGVQLQLQETFPFAESGASGTQCAGTLPTQLKNLLGYRCAWVNVFSNSDTITDQPYTLQVQTKWKVLPPDWGETEDQTVAQNNGQGGRLVDLVTPDPDAFVSAEISSQDPSVLLNPYGLPSAESRSLEVDWAWQHVKGDIDYYDVYIPAVNTRPANQPPCEFDSDPSLELRAHHMHLKATSGAQSQAQGDGLLEIPLTNAQSNAHWYLQLDSVSGHREVYRLTATWTKGLYFTPGECESIKAAKKFIQKLILSLMNLESLLKPDQIGPDPAPLINPVTLFTLGGYVMVGMDQGGTLDMAVSSALDQPVIARLYDTDGILLGEGATLGDEGLGITVPDGHVPQSQLTVGDLAAGAYLLQIVPTFGLGAAGMEGANLGFIPCPSGPCP